MYSVCVVVLALYTYHHSFPNDFRLAKIAALSFIHIRELWLTRVLSISRGKGKEKPTNMAYFDLSSQAMWFSVSLSVSLPTVEPCKRP